MQGASMKCAKQISAITGKPYGPTTASLLSKLKFPSNYWITLDGIKQLGIGLQLGELYKPFLLYKQGKSVFNAAQTTDKEKVENHARRIMPMFAISGKEISGNTHSLCSSPSNRWLTARHVKSLGVELTPNAVGIQIPSKDANKEKDTPHTFYPIESIIDYQKLLEITQRIQISGFDGIPYSRFEERIPLIRDSLAKNLKSNVWVSKAHADKLDLQIREDEQATTVPSGINKEIGVYNADQLVDPQPLLNQLHSVSRMQISGMTGKTLPHDISRQLANVRARNPSWSRYWIGFQEAFQKKILLPQTEKNIILDGRRSRLYANASQCKPTVLRDCISMHRKFEYSLNCFLKKVTLDGKRFSLSSRNGEFPLAILETVAIASSDEGKPCMDWVTEEFVQKIGATVKTGAAPHTVPVNDTKTNLYRADQLTDQYILEKNMEWALPQICCLKGSHFSPETFAILAKIVKENPFFCRLWMPYQEARKTHGLKANTFTVPIRENNKIVLYVNISQLKQDKVEEYVKAAEKSK